MASIERRKTKRHGITYDLRYRTPEKTMKRESFRTRREAESRKAEVNRSFTKGTWIDPSIAATPLRAVADKWVKAGVHKRDSTKMLDASVIEKYITPELGSKPIASITKTDVQSFVQFLNEQGLATSSIHRHFSILRAIFNFAIDSDLIVRNPCRTVKLPPVKSRKPMIATPEQMKLIAECLPERYRPMAWIASSCGLRWGEIAGLQAKHINFLRKTITVEQQVTRTKEGKMNIALPKTNAGKRTLTLPDTLIELLAAHFEKFDVKMNNPETVLFPTESGAYLHPSNFRQRMWIPACKAAGVIGLHFHDLRSTNATMLIMAGVDIKTAQMRMGHSSPRMTLEIYAQATQEGDKKAAELVESHLFHNETNTA